MIEDRGPKAIDAETVLAALAEPGRLAVYLSNGYGPPPWGLHDEQPEFVRVAVMSSAPPERMQAAREAWLAAAEELGVGPLRGIAPAELAVPAADSPWAAITAERRARVLRRGVEAMMGLGPEIGVFHINDEFGSGLLGRVQRALATGEGLMDVRLLEHMTYASLTYRLLAHTGVAMVVAETAPVESTWSMRQVFPEHAAVWRRSLVRGPVDALAGLSFAGLAELVVRGTVTRRGRSEMAASPAIASSLAEAQAALRPRMTDLLRERGGGGN